MEIQAGTTVEKLKKYFSQKAEVFAVEEAFLFGSFAHGTEKETSDLDIAVVLSGKRKAHKDKEFEVITDLSYDLCMLTDKEVEVVLIDEDFSNPMLFYNAIIHGTALFISDREKHLSLVLRALTEMEDFSLFGIKWQIEASEKRLKRIS